MDALALCSGSCDGIANMPVVTQKPLKGFSQASTSLCAGELLPEMSQQSEDCDTLVQCQHTIEQKSKTANSILEPPRESWIDY